MFKHKKKSIKKKCSFKNKSKDIIWKYLRTELENSSNPGLPYLVNTNLHRLERIFWACSFVGCLYLVNVLLTPLYTRYEDSPTVTSVEMDYFNWNVSYPAITLCPEIKASDQAYADLVREYRNRTGKDVSSYLWAIAHLHIDAIDKISIIPPDIIPLIPAKEYARIAATAFLKLDTDQVTTNTNWPIRIEAAMTELGMCHVINSNMAIFEDPLNWHQNSFTYEKKSINLTLYDGDFYIQIMNYASLYKVIIHSPDETTYNKIASYMHSKEQYLSLGVHVWSTTMKGALQETSIRFRKCRLINEPISKRYPVYSHTHCLIECRIRMIYKLCGCIPHWYRPLKHEKICSFANLTCVMEHKAEIMAFSVTSSTRSKFRQTKDLPNSTIDCGCPINCEGHVYRKDQETLISPSAFTRLKIGITSFPKVRFVREMIFGFYDIILRSGGVFNLCFGCSVISAMEILIMLVKPLVYFFVKLVQKK